MGGPVTNQANFKIWRQDHRTILYISATLSYAIDSELAMVWCWKGLWVNGIPRNSEGPRICNDLKDHFSSNRQPRGEQIYINCGLLSKDNSRTLRSRRCSTSKTNTVDRHAVGRSPHWVVRVVAGIENKKFTYQRLRITWHKGNQDSIYSDELT